MPTPEQHAEVAIAILDHIAMHDDIGSDERIELGLAVPRLGFPECLLCQLYGGRGCRRTRRCPGAELCRRYVGDFLFEREDWEKAYRYHAGRAP